MIAVGAVDSNLAAGVLLEHRLATSTSSAPGINVLSTYPVAIDSGGHAAVRAT